MKTNTTTRRAILAGAASVPIAAVALLPPNAMAAAALDLGVDAQAVTLTHQFLELAQRYDLVVDTEERTGDLFHRQRPEAPKELTITATDVLNVGIGNSRGGQFNELRIEQLRASKIMKVMLNAGGGTRRVVDKAAQKRADEIVAAFDRWQEEIERVKEASGYAAAERESSDLFDQLYSLAGTILALPIEALDGLVAKAVVQAWLQRGADMPEDEMPLEEVAGRAIARDLHRLRAGSPLIEAMGRIRYLAPPVSSR
jgi:hypothetical protein